MPCRHMPYRTVPITTTFPPTDAIPGGMVLMRLMGNDPSLDKDCGDEYDAAVDDWVTANVVSCEEASDCEVTARRLRPTHIPHHDTSQPSSHITSQTVPHRPSPFHNQSGRCGWLHGRHCLPKLELEQPCHQVRARVQSRLHAPALASIFNC